MDLALVLRDCARWILRTTPAVEGVSDGQIQEEFPAVARPACCERTVRAVAGLVRRTGSGSGRCQELPGHGAVWSFEEGSVPRAFGVGARHPQPRHVQSRIPYSRP